MYFAILKEAKSLFHPNQLTNPIMAKKKTSKSSRSNDDLTIEVPEKHMMGVTMDVNGKKTKVTLTFSENLNIHQTPQQQALAPVEDVDDSVEETREEEADLSMEEAEGKEVSVSQPEHSIKSPFMPRKEFVAAMRKLRKHALALVGLETTDKGECRVLSFKLSGNHNLKQSRVIMSIGKTSELTGKEIKFTTPQISLFGDKAKYDNAAALAREIDEVIDHAWNYMGGDYAEADGKQLALFERVTLNVK